jgi:hypothetical protein
LPETAQRCEQCGRIVRGQGSSICPDCGGDTLVRVLVQNVGEIRHHSSILTGTVTFCLGLTVLRLVAAFIDVRNPVVFAMSSELLVSISNLHIVVTACTALFLILRHYEGDFRSLFIVCLGLFILEEGVSILYAHYGIIPLQSLESLLNIALFMYGSLAMSAAVADGPKTDDYQRPLAVACFGFMLLACTRMILQIRGGTETHLNFASAILILLMAAIITVLLLRPKR